MHLMIIIIRCIIIIHYELEKNISYMAFLFQCETMSTNLGWGAFAKLQKATNSFDVYVCMSQLGSYRTDFYEILYSSVLRRSVERWVLDTYLYFTALPWNFSVTALKIACKKFINVTRIFTTTFHCAFKYLMWAFNIQSVVKIITISFTHKVM